MFEGQLFSLRNKASKYFVAGEYPTGRAMTNQEIIRLLRLKLDNNCKAEASYKQVRAIRPDMISTS